MNIIILLVIIIILGLLMISYYRRTNFSKLFTGMFDRENGLWVPLDKPYVKDLSMYPPTYEEIVSVVKNDQFFPYVNRYVIDVEKIRAMQNGGDIMSIQNLNSVYGESVCISFVSKDSNGNEVYSHPYSFHTGYQPNILNGLKFQFPLPLSSKIVPNLSKIIIGRYAGFKETPYSIPNRNNQESIFVELSNGFNTNIVGTQNIMNFCGYYNDFSNLDQNAYILNLDILNGSYVFTKSRKTCDVRTYNNY